MLEKTEGSSKTFMFDFSRKLDDGDTIRNIQSVEIPGGLSVDGDALVDEKAVLIRVVGGSDGESQWITVCVRTNGDDVLCIRDNIFVSAFDSYSNIV